MYRIDEKHIIEENAESEDRERSNKINEEKYNSEGKYSIDEKQSVELDLQSLSADTVSGHSVNGWTRFTTEEGWPYYYHAGKY